METKLQNPEGIICYGHHMLGVFWNKYLRHVFNLLRAGGDALKALVFLVNRELLNKARTYKITNFTTRRKDYVCITVSTDGHSLYRKQIASKVDKLHAKGRFPLRKISMGSDRIGTKFNPRMGFRYQFSVPV